MIRIQGGSARGRRLRGPSGYRFRPTTGRVKEFIFNTIGNEVKDARILDLFSGTGALGIEALSRGADKIVFIERSAENLVLLKKNLKLCEFSKNARVFKGDVFAILGNIRQKCGVFDFILADPPFKALYRARIIKGVQSHHLLKSDGLLIIEHDFRDTDSGKHRMTLLKQRRFGHCVISIYN